MPKRSDLGSILIIGSGPIIIGQACEFDYSGTQACKALQEEGYRVILANSNPATIMTDPEFADVTYIEPLTVQALEKIIEKEKPDALLPTIGGQTGLNLSLELANEGILEKHGVELIGAKQAAIEKGEDRELFKKAMLKIGLDVARSDTAGTVKEAIEIQKAIGGDFPVIIRPSFTLGGTGGGIAYNLEEFEVMVANGLDLSPVRQILVEECLLGWKEFEMEVMRDHKDQCIVICSIENFDPMGVHTGDSITVAPAMTLTDKEYQLMRDASFACIREVGVETGGSNIQFSVNPRTGRMVVIEMNPRVSRSSALASKATGFPIAKIAAKLAVGYTLDELPNDITRETPASFEPTIDYVVTKIPRFAFEKFPQSDQTLTSAMKSVGEAMAIGRTFKESFQKALRSMETGALGFSAWKGINEDNLPSKKTLLSNIRKPTAERIFHLRLALFAGIPIEELHAVTGIDPWFLDQLNQIVEMEKFITGQDINILDEDLLRRAKEWGFSDHQLSILLNCEFRQVRARRDDLGIDTQFRLVDTCAAEFEASTPYFYSSYGDENELVPSDRKKIMIIGGGPNRIGQGIEFDYCCVHASFALREIGIETVMVNSNPETVSTDYDTSDKLYFEPLTLENISEIFHQEKCDGAIVQFGGQTPLTLALELKAAGVHIIGTTPEDIEVAEDRKHFKAILDKIGLKQPQNDIAVAREEASVKAAAIGYPVLLRPSFVLGGRGMFIVFDDDELMSVVDEVFDVAPGKPVLLDKFLDEAIELDVDCISDGSTSVIGGILQHIEYAGVHSGDATMVMPPHSLDESMRQIICDATYALARELNVVGLMNVQFAVKDNELFVLEVNPRASRTVPFVSKVIGKPLAKMAARVMVGESLEAIGFTKEVHPPFWAVKESVFPFSKFPGASVTLSPEMKSTGEVMGLDKDLGMAYAKAQMAAKPALPMQGNVFISVKDRDKTIAVDVAQDLVSLGFKIYSTSGTTAVLEENGIEVSPLFRIGEGRPTVIDMLKNGKIDMIVNTPAGQLPRKHENAIRTEAVLRNVCIMTSMTSAQAAVNGIRALKKNPLEVKCLQLYAADLD
ncbi:MAG: carbamoyl-phosphate synthase large subunit [Opitutae bacterium]|jgi:carbamoyl-phosphate synthase large subunit|nr:carbamoyl-phosphate synthase large subunit [Opitutae bacterium]MBT5690359.1 carbamoyl-phosphate synthase large subunit [Opitutae bacterium]MBT6463706.1 carbamoyl-phosphate synthase large subunit [Opitutae bacterium]MBT7851791.1 carbamoyl-phosphate synthase large subunit [Opitutae bacterium]